jgi:hypothetical protein
MQEQAVLLAGSLREDTIYDGYMCCIENGVYEIHKVNTRVHVYYIYI